MQYWFFPLVQLQLFVSRGQTGSLTQHVYLQHRELNREQVQAASDTLNTVLMYCCFVITIIV